MSPVLAKSGARSADVSSRDAVDVEISAAPLDAQPPFDRELEQEKMRAYTGWCLAAMLVLIVFATAGTAIARWWRG
jgi:hypothetical protein